MRELGIRSYLGHPLHSPDGFILGTLCVADTKPRRWSEEEISTLRDLTKEAEKHIALAQYQRMHRASDELIKRVATRARGVIFQFRVRPDGSSYFPYASEAIRQVFRVSPEEVARDADKVFSLIHPDDRQSVEEAVKESCENLTPWLHKYRIQFGEDDVHWLLGDAVPEREPDGGTLWHGYITDITNSENEQTRTADFERQLLETQKLESLGVLAGGIAHDFNNILTGILGNASLASLELPSTSPAQGHLQEIRRGSKRAADLCNQMLAYAGKGRFVVTNLSLNQLIQETTHLLQISISKTAVLWFNLFPTLPPIAADATQIRQVIMNLVINASEAIGDRSGVISVNTGLTTVDKRYLGGTVHMPELPEGTYVYLEVSDSGCGMTPQTQAKIFEPFFTTKFSGRGLGLAAVLGIVRSHKGALKVYSEPSRGTTFKLLFPTAQGEVDTPPAHGDSFVAWRGRGSILVADDEESVRSTAAQMLRKLGFDVALAADGREALDAFRANPDGFALVLMDLTMPHIDGRQAFRELRQIRKDIKVVLMSGFSQQDALSEFMGKGLAGFLQKPFDSLSLANALMSVLTDSKAG